MKYSTYRNVITVLSVTTLILVAVIIGVAFEISNYSTVCGGTR